MSAEQKLNPLASGAISVNGVVTAVADARVPAMDHGFLYGDSVYEVVRTYRGLPLDMDQHLARLRVSAASIYFELPWEDAEFRARIRMTVAATGLPDAYVRIVVTRGPGPMSLLPDGCGPPTIVIYALPLRVPSAEQLRDGIVITVPERLRNDQRALAPAAKTGNYLNNALALMEAHRSGAADAVMLNTDGHVTEATTANVFWVRDGQVRTPALTCGILAGITRTRLLAAMRKSGMEVAEGAYPLDDLLAADEVFLTGTLKGVLGVIRVGGSGADTVIGAGRPGPITARVAELHTAMLGENTQPW